MNICILDRWYDWCSEGHEQYMTVGLGDGTMCDIKRKEDGFMYVMDSGNGGNVYVDSDTGIRDLTDEEYDEVIEFAGKEFEKEGMI